MNWDKYLRKEDASKVGDGEGVTTRVNEVNYLLSDHPIKKDVVLDVGASKDINKCMKGSGFKITGLSLIPKHGIVGDMHEMPFDDKSFGIVFCMHTLEHAISPYIVLCEINRVLKENGSFVLIIPEEGDFWTFAPHHYYCLTLRQTMSLLQKTGFKIIRMVRFKDKLNYKEIKQDLGFLCEKVRGWEHDILAKEFTYMIPYEAEPMQHNICFSTQDIFYIENSDERKSTHLK